jgi:hypothetical protein
LEQIITELTNKACTIRSRFNRYRNFINYFATRSLTNNDGVIDQVRNYDSRKVNALIIARAGRLVLVV